MASHGVFRKLIFTSDVRFGDDEKYSNKCIFKQTRVGRGNYMLKSMETDVDSGHRGPVAFLPVLLRALDKRCSITTQNRFIHLSRAIDL